MSAAPRCGFMVSCVRGPKHFARLTPQAPWQLRGRDLQRAAPCPSDTQSCRGGGLGAQQDQKGPRGAATPCWCLPFAPQRCQPPHLVPKHSLPGFCSWQTAQETADRKKMRGCKICLLHLHLHAEAGEAPCSRCSAGHSPRAAGGVLGET